MSQRKISIENYLYKTDTSIRRTLLLVPRGVHLKRFHCRSKSCNFALRNYWMTPKLQLLSIAMRKEIKTKFSKMCRLVRSRVTIKCLIPVQQRSQQFYLSPCIYEEYHPPGYRRLHIQQGSFSLSFYCPCMGLLWNLVELQRSNDLHLSFFLEIEWFFFGFHGRTWQNMYWDWTLDVPDWSRMIEVFLLDNTVCIE